MGRKVLAASVVLIAAAAIAVVAAAVYVQARSYPAPFWSTWMGNNSTAPQGVGKLPAWFQRGFKELKAAVGPRVEVSEEYREKVTYILEQDGDTAKLLEEGYNVTRIRPIIKAYVGPDGAVTLRASQALVTLVKKGSGLAVALVDLDDGKVAKLVLYTKTVIEK